MTVRTRRIPGLVLSAGCLLLADGCGEGGRSATPSARQSEASSSPSIQGQPITGPVPCKPHGSHISIVANPGPVFSTDCLAVTADAPFTIKLINDDDKVPAVGSPRHNVGIYGESTYDHEIFSGTVADAGETIVDRIGALPRGIYYFRCDLHHLILNMQARSLWPERGGGPS